MFDDFVLDDIDMFDDIDTSDVDFIYSSDDSVDFFESIGIDDNSDFLGFDEFCSFDINDSNQPIQDDSDFVEESNGYLKENDHYASRVSFGKTYGHCHHVDNYGRRCLCQKFEGAYGAVCSNCYHGFDHHY